MLTEICAYLKNYFEYEKYIGNVVVNSGTITVDGKSIALGEGQYFALFRDRFAIGVFKQGDTLKDRTFHGAVWLMDVPEAVVKADTWAETWMQKNGGADSENNSAFQSESFGGYSYNKGSNSNGKAGASIFDNAQFAAMLSPYRKIR